jgi:hypothetical protein
MNGCKQYAVSHYRVDPKNRIIPAESESDSDSAGDWR